MSDLQILIDAAATYIEMGFKAVPNNGKEPIDAVAWQHRRYTVGEIESALQSAASPAIGLQMGPDGGLIDIEADSDHEEAIFLSMFGGDVPPVTVTYTSNRGKHRFFLWDDRFSGTGRGIVSINGRKVGKLGCRIGADGKGAQSIVPPSDGRTWLVSFDDCEPAKLPDVVVERILIVKLMSAQPEGVPSRAQHPSIVDDGLLKILGRLKNPRMGTVNRNGETVPAVRFVFQSIGDGRAGWRRPCAGRLFDARRGD